MRSVDLMIDPSPRKPGSSSTTSRSDMFAHKGLFDELRPGCDRRRNH